MALISLNNLERFFNNLKTYISNALNSKANTSHTHTTADISNLAENWNVTGTNLDISFAGSSNNNGQLSIQINGTDITTFMANQITNSVFNLNFNSFGYNLIPATDNAYDLGSSSYVFKNIYGKNYKLKEGNVSSIDASHAVGIYGGTNHSDGGCIILYGKDNTSSSGQFSIRANNGTNSATLQGTPSGTLTWGSKNIAMAEDVIPRSGGAVLSGDLFTRTVDNSYLVIYGGRDSPCGSIELYGKDFLYAGFVSLKSQDSSNHSQMVLRPTGTWTWDGTAVQLISDQRLKQQISEIDDKLLDAWEDVNLVQFKYNDAVDQKGNNARLHTGFVVQQIDEACKSHNVDISEYGLYCHEEYPEETREIEHDDGTKTTEVVRPANEHYSLRYTEALVVECAYLRKQIELLQERLNKLEEK